MSNDPFGMALYKKYILLLLLLVITKWWPLCCGIEEGLTSSMDQHAQAVRVYSERTNNLFVRLAKSHAVYQIRRYPCGMKNIMPLCLLLSGLLV